MRASLGSLQKKLLIQHFVYLFAFLFIFQTFIDAQKKPNIIFILADDVGYSVPAINGGQSYSTPAIDYMARHGMNFTFCEASPLCSTSRCMFLTGKYNFRNYSNWGYMNEKEKTIANVMRDAGYATGVFGKHQLPYNDTIMHRWGWDYNIVFELTEDTMRYSRYKNPVLVENGYRIPDSVTANKYCDDILTQKIFDFIEDNKTKPFFVYYPMSIGHSPYSPTPDDPEFATWDPKLRKSDTSFFPSMMRYMDKKVGLILNWLRLKGLDKNTIVFYAGDNGVPPEIYYNANGVKHIRGEKGNPTEGGTHVPLIAYWSGHIQEGSSNGDLIDFTDLLPTFAEAAQVTKLNKYGILDGKSFYPALFGQPHVTKQQLFCHFDPHPGFTYLWRWTRDKTYKLYDSTGVPRSGNFYNTVNDKKELYPLKSDVLTHAEKQIRQRFLNVLDTIGNWPEAPIVQNAYSDKITNTSARITATITSKGASRLIDRGSTLARANTELPFLNWGRMHDSIVKAGTFSQVRKGLLPQTFYRYTLYAMNNNKSNSTAFALDSFYTLSNPPLSQPGTFTASVSYASVNLSWDNARFPSSGATNAGYLLVYAPGNIKIVQDPNGKAPSGIVMNGRIIEMASAVLPKMPSFNAKISDLPAGIYQFLLIPYTWDGSNTETYNYLIKDAVTATAAISRVFAFNP
ncbi:MAG TPA: sulfatase-like hydrolase/transferase [Parafilimonas sp.]|nr:sulfatase-like hydrolase/transferase [Parafilimonas sp.]